MLDSIKSDSYPLPLFPPAPEPTVSPEVVFYQHFLGPGTTVQEAEAFMHGMETWMNSVFSSYAKGERGSTRL